MLGDFMSLSIFSRLSSSLFAAKEVDSTFIDVLQQAAKDIGSSTRNYLMLSGGKLGFTSLKSKEVSLEKLKEFVNEKLKDLPEQKVAVDKDLSKIGAEYLRRDQVKFNISSDVLNKAMGFSDSVDLLNTGSVSRDLKKASEVERSRRFNIDYLKEITFGSKKWKTYFNLDIGKVPPLPSDILKILYGPCPFSQNKKKVIDTHMLVLIPGNLSLNKFMDLVEESTQGNKTDFENIWNQILKDHGKTLTKAPQWVLMTKDVLLGSRTKSYADQKALVKATPKYEVPNLLSAAVCILVQYVSTGVVLYGRDADRSKWTYTRCQEQSGGYQIVVGGFAPSGLFVFNLNLDIDSVGVAALRKL